MCHTQHLATNSKDQGANFDSNLVGRLLHSESHVQAVSPTRVGQIYYNFAWLLLIAWQYVMQKTKPPSPKKVKVTTCDLSIGHAFMLAL